MKIQSNTVRIIAGQWRSRKLNFPDAEGLRPTSDRIRETLFNWLQMPIVAADCLDLFAGSGACGIEALSRGARHVSFVDSSAQAIAALRRNLALLGAVGATLHQQDAASFLRPSSGAQAVDRQQYDIVFIDPPFGLGVLEATCQQLEASGLLKPQALIYLESGAPLSGLRLPTGWEMTKSRQAGAVHFGLCDRHERASAAMAQAGESA